MKAEGLVYGFCVSLLLHGAVLGTVMVAGSGREDAEEPELPTRLTLTIISASDEEVTQVREKSTVTSVAPPKGQQPTPPQVAVLPALPTLSCDLPELLPISEPVQSQPALVKVKLPQPDTKQPTVIPASVRPRVGGSAQAVGPVLEPGGNGTGIPSAGGSRYGPAYRKNPVPSYPTAARRRGQEGAVLLGVRITAEGRAVRVQVTQSSGFPLLDEAAVKAVSDWEFEPARVDSRGVESDIEVPIHFRLSR